MHNPVTKEDEEGHVGLESTVSSPVDAPPEEEYSHILDRKSMTKREFNWLWAGVLIQAVCMSFEVQLTNGISGFVNAYFEASSLQSVLRVIQAVISTSFVPLYTKVSDVVGRAPSLSFAFVCYLVGLSIEGSSGSFKHLAAGQIVSSLGMTGIQALSQVVIADTTSLLTRGIMFAMYDVGMIANMWISQALIDPLTLGGAADKWRTAYILAGCITGFGALAFMVPLWYVQGQLRRRKALNPPRKNLRWLAQEFDIPGAALLTISLSCICFPLTLARRMEGNFQNPVIIGTLCTGAVASVLFVIWEARWAKRPILSNKIWSNRTAFGSMMVIFFIKLTSHMALQYLTQYFVVSRNLTFGNATLLMRAYHMAWLVCQVIAGLLMKRFKKARLMVWVGVIAYYLGIGLMLPARHYSAPTAFIVATQILAGIGVGFAHLACSVIVTGVVHKRDIASVVGFVQVLVSFGAAIAGAIAGALWTQYLPIRLEARVTGPLVMRRAMNDPLNYVQKLPEGTKSQVIEAYSDSVQLLLIVSLALAVPIVIGACMIKHVDLDQDQDTQDRIALGEAVPVKKDDDEDSETKN